MPLSSSWGTCRHCPFPRMSYLLWAARLWAGRLVPEYEKSEGGQEML